MRKPPRPTVAEKVGAKLAAAKAPTFQINDGDVRNVIFAARHGLAQLRGPDLVNVSNSIDRLEHALAQASAVPAQPAPPADAPAGPAPVEKA